MNPPQMADPYHGLTYEALAVNMMRAAEHGHVDDLRRLLDKGIVDINAKHKIWTGWHSVLNIAIQNCRCAVVKLLLERGVRMSLDDYFRASIMAVSGDSGKRVWTMLNNETALRAVLNLQRSAEYARMPRELFGMLFTYLN